ncbi:hypothetical protein DD509_04530 [Dehalogenimonas alkenigignens]|uniref:Uncharacterized protein n=1 Tax=Dehalogenimonas alkenigignens TaxID=1217799 RepID=A0A0W0GGX3_9CHLR|nr:hypothetical protein DEALK_06410 [Dehalogenimonas alkenigignens]PVV83947.1 hypothetical protein DD509_04530 [Dehalogenimonas alkenigignens]
MKAVSSIQCVLLVFIIATGLLLAFPEPGFAGAPEATKSVLPRITLGGIPEEKSLLGLVIVSVVIVAALLLALWFLMRRGSR